MTKNEKGGSKPFITEQDAERMKNAIRAHGSTVYAFLKRNGFTQGYINAVVSAHSDATRLVKAMEKEGIAFEPSHGEPKGYSTIDRSDIEKARGQLYDKGISMSAYMRSIGKTPAYIYVVCNRKTDATWLIGKMAEDGIRL